MPRKSKTTKPRQAGVVPPIDSDLVARAYRKLMDRKELTAQEREALKRFEKRKEEKLRWQYYA